MNISKITYFTEKFNYLQCLIFIWFNFFSNFKYSKYSISQRKEAKTNTFNMWNITYGKLISNTLLAIKKIVNNLHTKWTVKLCTLFILVCWRRKISITFDKIWGLWSNLLARQKVIFEYSMSQKYYSYYCYMAHQTTKLCKIA